MTLKLESPTAAQTLISALDAKDSADELARAPFTPVYLLQVLSTAVASLLDAQGTAAADDAALVRALLEAEADHA